jgi:hypothetical protein
MTPLTPARKAGTGDVRSDDAPLLKRFALLGQPQSVKWMSGTMGDGEAPGPSTYWIDAIVRLSSAQVTEMEQRYALTLVASSVAPDVQAGLRKFLPQAPWKSSEALNAALSQGGFKVKAFVSADGLTLTAVGQ